jgi:hypothetical protein
VDDTGHQPEQKQLVQAVQIDDQFSPRDAHPEEELPGTKGREGGLIEANQAVQPGGPTARISHDEQRLFDGLLAPFGIEPVVQEKTDMVEDHECWNEYP